jgi:signal peptidase II
MIKSVGKYALILFVLAIGLNADLFTKKWAHDTLKGRPVLKAIPGVLELGFIENRGMVFGILNRSDKPHGFVSVVSWVRLAVCLGVSVYIVMKRAMPFFFLLPLLLIWLGAIGNLIDHFRLRYVIDFIHIHAGTLLDWPFFFNLADAYVCVGAALLFLNGVLYPEKPKTPSPT